jgi:prepilin-type processing-associated H-X9-DG protein
LEEYRPWDGKPVKPSAHVRFWETWVFKDTTNVPVLMDSSWAAGLPDSNDPPPKYDDYRGAQEGSWAMHDFCINRHDGGINGLFMDWSVRKVGLKELWTLKWHRKYDTAGPWTKASGVRPQDWPKWMRRFRDY